jgi:cytochrome c-type biogenesis protein
MTSLIISAFVAGVLMFLAPCTLPLVPAYLAFISGADGSDFQSESGFSEEVRKRIFMNGVWYVVGFSVVFVFLGVLVAYVGSALVGTYRMILMQAGGVLVMYFGLYMLGIVKAPSLSSEKRWTVSDRFERGRPLTSFLLGAAFATGWTPCIGPILASILLVASTAESVGRGAILLGVFSLGMGIPFIILAGSIGSAYGRVKAMRKYMPVISRVGGVFLVILGGLLLSGQLGLLVGWGFQLLGFLGYEKILQLY